MLVCTHSVSIFVYTVCFNADLNYANFYLTFSNLYSNKYVIHVCDLNVLAMYYVNSCLYINCHVYSMLCDVSLFLYNPELAVGFIVPEFTKPGSLDCRQMSVSC